MATYALTDTYFPLNYWPDLYWPEATQGATGGQVKSMFKGMLEGVDMAWILNQQNRITFVMVDSNGSEVSGLGSGFTLQLAKAGGAFVASGGTKAEMASGWYTYLATAAEANTLGPVSIIVTGAGVIQQNLEYVIQQRNPNAVAFTYTVTANGNPLEGVHVFITTDLAGNNVVWAGDTDAFGIARDDLGNLPYLDPGSYYFWKQLSGYSDNQNPDLEVIS